MKKEFGCPLDKPIQQMGIKTKLDRLYFEKTKKEIYKLEADIKKDTELYTHYNSVKNHKKVSSGKTGKKIKLDSQIEREIRRKLKDKKIKGKKISTLQIDKIIKLIKLGREYNVKMDTLNSSKCKGLSGLLPSFDALPLLNVIQSDKYLTLAPFNTYSDSGSILKTTIPLSSVTKEVTSFVSSFIQ